LLKLFQPSDPERCDPIGENGSQMTQRSRLILAYAGSKKAAEDVGFYYAADAAGRLIGIVLSGALAQYGSLPACHRVISIVFELSIDRCMGQSHFEGS
jgi:hypothetical protein